MYSTIVRRLGRRALIFTALLSLPIAGLVAGATPAFADATLCSGSSYSTCTSVGYTDHGYGANNGTMYWSMFAGHNCTNYVAEVESTVNGAPTPSYSLGNAYEWAGNASAHGVTVNGTPALGAVAQWNVSTAHSSGHVAIVEAVNGDGSITISSDTWSTGPFAWQTIMSGSSNWPSNFIHFRDLPTAPSGGNYQPFVADFNGDGVADIGLRDASIGLFYIKHGSDFGDQVTYAWAAGANYQPFAGDFNHDGWADIGVRDSANGVFYIKHGSDFGDQVTYPWAAGANYQPFVADFNGDGYADIGLRDTATGTFFIKHGPSFGDQISYAWAAGSNYQPFAADFNGDGVADIGLRDSSNGNIFIKHGPSFGDQISYAWAAGTNYRVFAADFNGDGYADIGLRDSANGVFYIKHGLNFGDQISYPWAAG